MKPSAPEYFSLCEYADCPTRHPDFKGDKEGWHRCWVCGAEAGDHAHVISRARRPSKKHEASNIIFLCRRHHDAVDRDHTHGHAVKRLGDGLLHYFYWQSTPYKELCDRVVGEAGGSAAIGADSPYAKAVPTPAPLSTHPLTDLARMGRAERDAALDGAHFETDPETPQDEAVTTSSDGPVVYADPPDFHEPVVMGRAQPPPDVSYEALGDEELAVIYADADRRQRQGFLDKCRCIYTYRERHVQAWGESWTEQAYELFEGAPSRRTLYAYANIGQIISDASDTNLVEHLGPLTDSASLMQFIGRKKPEAGAVALEAAVAYVAEYGEAPSVAALAHKLNEEVAPKPECVHTWLTGRLCSHCRTWEETG